MRKLSVTGQYNIDGKSIDFVGIFNLDDDSRMLGNLTGFLADEVHYCPRHIVDGKLQKIGGGFQMEFVKTPVDASHDPVYHDLFFRTNFQGSVGVYEGLWSYKPKEFDKQNEVRLRLNLLM